MGIECVRRFSVRTHFIIKNGRKTLWRTSIPPKAEALGILEVDVMKRLFPNLKIVESKKIINIFRRPLLLKLRAPFWLVDFLGLFLPKYYYLALLQKE